MGRKREIGRESLGLEDGGRGEETGVGGGKRIGRKKILRWKRWCRYGRFMREFQVALKGFDHKHEWITSVNP